MSVRKTIRLVVPAVKAKPAPAIGQALGALGVNMMMFLKEFNAKSTQYKENIPMRVALSCIPGQPAFTFVTKLPTTSWMLKQAAGIEKGSAQPGHQIVGEVNIKQVYEIAKLKHTENPQLPFRSVARSVASTCIPLGIQIVGTKHKED